MMGIEHIDDWEKRLARQDAFWDRAILDRPVVTMAIPRPNPAYPRPVSAHTTVRDRWMDAQYAVDQALHGVMNAEYLGDALPAVWPNVGPEVLSAFFGCELEFSETTSWAVPNLPDWSEADRLQFSEDNFYWKKMLELTDALLEAGRGKFYAGITDLHPGGDAVAAFRDPMALNLDMIDAAEEVKALIARVGQVYFRVYDFYYEKLKGAGQAITSWPGIVSSRKWYVPSNDFSCMVSKAMFDEVFLPGIIEECRHMEASVYHLDGPQALRHLDSLLAIPELNAIQWVYGAGNGRASDWMHVYRKCQAAGKGLQIHLEADEIDTAIENLKPEGLWLSVQGPATREEAAAVLRRFERWT